MSLQLGAVKQLVLSIRQKICGMIRNVRECVKREAFPHTHYTVHGTCGEKISAVRKTQVENHTVSYMTKGSLDMPQCSYAEILVSR